MINSHGLAVIDHFNNAFWGYWVYVIAFSVLLVLLLLIYIRHYKYKVRLSREEPNMDFSHFFPKLNKKLFLPKGWTIEKDDKILEECCLKDLTYIGWVKKKRVLLPGSKALALTVPDKERLYHCQVVGTTGAGKTETLFNFIAQDILKGYGCCIVDPKSDDDFLEKLVCHIKACGLMDKFHFFSMMYPGKSHVYNPVQHGTTEEIAERIINAANIEHEYYKNIQFNFILCTINILREVKPIITLNDIVEFLKRFHDQDWVKDNITDQTSTDLTPYLREVFKRKQEDISGILAILNQITSGAFNPILNGPTEIDIKTIINTGQIALFQIPVMKYATIGKALGKMILQDIQSVVGGRQSLNVDPTFKKKNFYPIYLDEFYSLAYPAFVELINKARSAGVAIHLGHQSQADLSQVSKEFKEAVFENTNIKIISKQNDAASCEEFAKSFGTFQTIKETKAVKKGLLFNYSSESSVREVEEFIVHPNLIKTAKVGQGIVKLRSAQATACQYRMFHRLKDVGKFTLDFIPRKPKEKNS